MSSYAQKDTDAITNDPAEEIFSIVEQMPILKTCADRPEKEQKACTEAGLTQSIYANIAYPKRAKASESQGTVYVQFVVEKDGSIGNITILRGVSPGLDDAAVRAVEQLPDMLPGSQRGQAVRVNYILPIKFKLD